MLDIASIVLVMVALVLAGSVVVFQFITGVPPMPSAASEIADVVALLKQAGVAEQGVIYELGCGWGSLALALAKAFPHAQIRGIELSPVPYWVARLRTRNLSNVQLYKRNFYDCDLRDADAVTSYLTIKPTSMLGAFLDRILPPGTPVVSVTFWFRGRQVAAVRQGKGLRGKVALYFWPAN